jgi:hypothetical protein
MAVSVDWRDWAGEMGFSHAIDGPTLLPKPVPIWNNNLEKFVLLVD